MEQHPRRRRPRRRVDAHRAQPHARRRRRLVGFGREEPRRRLHHALLASGAAGDREPPVPEAAAIGAARRRQLRRRALAAPPLPARLDQRRQRPQQRVVRHPSVPADGGRRSAQRLASAPVEHAVERRLVKEADLRGAALAHLRRDRRVDVRIEGAQGSGRRRVLHVPDAAVDVERSGGAGGVAEHDRVEARERRRLEVRVRVAREHNVRVEQQGVDRGADEAANVVLPLQPQPAHRVARPRRPQRRDVLGARQVRRPRARDDAPRRERLTHAGVLREEQIVAQPELAQILDQVERQVELLPIGREQDELARRGSARRRQPLEEAALALDVAV